MKSGMKMMMMDNVRQNNSPRRSEYGAATSRRMIGYDREAEPAGMTYDAMPMRPMPARQIPPDMRRGNAWLERRMPKGNAYGGAYEMPADVWEDPYTLNDTVAPESRRRRDKRGRYMLGGAEYDDDDDPDDYRPKGMMPGIPRPRGNAYGDIYAEGTIYAPNAMNQPMSGAIAGTMTGDMSAPVDEHTARKWVGKMEGGEHFKLEHTEQFRTATCPECDKWEYFVAMNAMYSDHCETAKKFGVDRPEYYAHLARDFLKDKDAGPHKLRKYMETIPKK